MRARASEPNNAMVVLSFHPISFVHHIMLTLFRVRHEPREDGIRKINSFCYVGHSPKGVFHSMFGANLPSKLEHDWNGSPRMGR